MKRKLTRKRILISLTSFVLVCAVFAGLLTLSEPMPASAVSLPHIETIKSSGSFDILEIVPESSAGSIGYYVDGSEPCADWAVALRSISGTANRETYINTLFGNLVSNGMLGSTTDSALKLRYAKTASGSYYTEFYSWEIGPSSSYTLVRLNNPETVEVSATYEKREGGVFRSNYVAEINAEGTHSENVRYFTAELTPNLFYYAPTFIELLYEEKEAYIGYAMYTLDEETSVYTYAGIVGTTPMTADTVYYVVTDYGFPSSVQDESTPYAAVADTDTPYVEDANGSFVLTFTGYTYVGSGYGDSDIVSLAGEQTVSISYSTIYCKTGFTNNNLFIRDVFDISQDQLSNPGFSVSVNAKTAAQVTRQDVADADMIVLSCGYVPANPLNDLKSSYNAGNDIAADVAFDIYSRVCSDCPIIVDGSLTTADTSLNITSLARLCLQTGRTTGTASAFGELSYTAPVRNDSDGFFVDGCVLCFSRCDVNASASLDALATKSFSAVFENTVVNDGFKDVLNEITNENFYRTIDGTTELLGTEITLSRAMRYIINYAGRRIITVKNSIRVLEIQPAAVNTPLSKQTVLSWLGSSAVGLSADDITVVTMTTGEFIGKIEDINEVYDLVYIGASIDSFNKSGGETNYNDNSMDGLIYSAIGDLYRSDIRMAGLLQRDYITTAANITGIDATSGNQSNLFRFSGNDITSKKVKQLREYVEAGYPVIVADSLMSGANVYTYHVDSSSYMYEALNSIKNAANFMTASQTSGANAGSVLKYLQVSKPALVLTEYPTDYTILDNGIATSINKSADGYYYLQYRFSILNVTDATPLSTTYNANLYIDLNADGKFSSSELLSDVELYSAGVRINSVIEGTNEYYRLSAGVEYTIKRQMPTNFVGVIPWKLEIVKNGAVHIHASENGYTRIATSSSQKQLVKILQIASTNASSSSINLQSQLQVDQYGSNPQLKGKDGRYYKGIYGKLIADLDDFTVKCDIIEADDLERYSSTDAIFAKLDQYNMLIIGFNDMYDGIGEKSAQAITSFIASQKSVLFTHDTTSQANVPYSSYPMITDDNLGGSEEITVPTSGWERNNDYVTISYNSRSKTYSVNFRSRKKGKTKAYAYKTVWLEKGTYTLSCTVNRNGGSLNMYIGVDEERDGFNADYDESQQIAAAYGGDVSIEFTVGSDRYVDLCFAQVSATNAGNAEIKDFVLTKKSGTAPGSIGFDGALSYWGYYFNTVIRDAVGLDRYGITSPVSIGGPSIKDTLFAQTDSTNLSQQIISSILEKEHDVAFTPKTSRVQTVAETQGYTNYALIRYGLNGWLKPTSKTYSARETSNVSQVNEGQITTYPYNINTVDFGGSIGSGNVMTVGGTHEQYYQLNMNTDDIVVWYCMTGKNTSDSYYSDSPNDVVNSYYIFNNGNVTYSGVGHTSGNSNYTGNNIEQKYINEAKLFVNTMIAAYQSGAQVPSLSIKSSSAGTSDIDIKYFVTESNNSDDQIIGEGSVAAENKAIYFKITEPNLDADKRVSLKYYIVDSNGSEVSWSLDKVREVSMTTYLPSGEVPLTIKGGIVYKVYVPDSIISKLTDEDVTSIRMYIRVCTEIGTQKLYNQDYVELRKIGLFSLS